MTNRFNKPAKVKPLTKTIPGQRIPVTADQGQWGVWVGPGLWVTANSVTAPSRFHRFMQRLLLGWRWQVKQ